MILFQTVATLEKLCITACSFLHFIGAPGVVYPREYREGPGPHSQFSCTLCQSHSVAPRAHCCSVPGHALCTGPWLCPSPLLLWLFSRCSQSQAVGGWLQGSRTWRQLLPWYPLPFKVGFTWEIDSMRDLRFHSFVEVRRV